MRLPHSLPVIALLLCSLTPPAKGLGGDLFVESGSIRVTIDDHTGAVRQVTNKVTGHNLLATPGTVPFLYSLVANTDFANDQHHWPDSSLKSSFVSFSHFWVGPVLHLTWVLDSKFTLKAKVEITGERDVSFTPIIEDNDPTRRVNMLMYPVFDRVQRWPGGGTDCAVGDNYIFFEPAVVLEKRVLLYFEQDSGGFYFGMHDPKKRHYDPGHLAMSYQAATNDHQIRAVHRNTTSTESVDLGYPVVVTALLEGNWYEGAEIFRSWVTRQSWCASTLYERVTANPPRASRWLSEEVGFCSFGLACDAPFSRLAFTGMRKVAELPVFHVLGYDWSSNVVGYPWQFFGDMDSYSPPSYDDISLTSLRRQGDHYAPFVFDFWYNVYDRRTDAMRPLAVLTGQNYRLQLYTWLIMCTQTEFWESFHSERDRRAVQWGCDASYYDISESFECWDASHDHPLGTFDKGRIYAASHYAASQAKGSYYPVGREYLETHRMVDEIDFYQSREGAGPVGAWEAADQRARLLAGTAERIPFVDFALHEYGPVRMDGWGTLAKEWGNIFWWVAAGTFLDGALFQLNYEFSGVDLYPGMTANDSMYLRYPDGQYASDPGHAFQVDQVRADFVKEGARARTEFARPYLAYGRMTRPAKHSSPAAKASFDYWAFNLPDVDPGDEGKGSFMAADLVERGWVNRDKSLAYFYVNLLDQSRDLVNVVLDPVHEGFLSGNFVAYAVSTEDCQVIARFTDRTVLPKFKLRSKRIEMIEIVPDALAGPASIQGMTAFGFNDTVVLSWRVPPGGIAEVLVLRKEGDVFPRDLTDGVLVYQGSDLTCVDYSVKAGVSYRYAAFAKDARGNTAHGDVDGARATGTPAATPNIKLSLVGSARAGQPFEVNLDAPADAGKFYFVLAALADRPEIFLGDGRYLGIEFDGLVLASLDPTFPRFRGFLGYLSGTGSAKATVDLPAQWAPQGLKIYFASLLLDPAGPFGIGKISKTLVVELH